MPKQPNTPDSQISSTKTSTNSKGRRKLSENYRYFSPPPQAAELLFQQYQHREPLESDNTILPYAGCSASFRQKHYADQSISWEIERAMAGAKELLRP